MHVSFRLVRQVLAVALFITLMGFGSLKLQAQKSDSGECVQPQPQSCPQTLREKPTAPPAESCCPVDPKEVAKAQKDSLHAQHEAAEACRRQQRAAMRAQKRIDEAYERGTRNVESANAKLETRKGESAEAIAKAETLQAQQNAQVAAVMSQQSATQSEAMETQPQPVTPPESAEVQPVTPPESAQMQPETVTPEPSVETPSTPEASAAPTQSAENTPKELPRTASPLELLGLIGLASSISGYVTRRLSR